jgi:hypothetical protein
MLAIGRAASYQNFPIGIQPLKAMPRRSVRMPRSTMRMAAMRNIIAFRWDRMRDIKKPNAIRAGSVLAPNTAMTSIPEKKPPLAAELMNMGYNNPHGARRMVGPIHFQSSVAEHVANRPVSVISALSKSPLPDAAMFAHQDHDDSGDQTQHRDTPVPAAYATKDLIYPRIPPRKE